MLLVDTSVWIEHLRRGEKKLAEHLIDGKVLGHPFVLGEVALGNLRQRAIVLSALRELPQATVASDLEVMRFIDAERLFGVGIGYVDAHLLASVHLTPGARLWTRDRRLKAAAERLGMLTRIE